MVAVRIEPLRAVSLEYWMTDLPPYLKDYPLTYLAIPGSHDSMSYGITRSSALAPDAPAVLRRLMPLFLGTIIRWTKTQDIDVTHQLNIGIRYLDLRIATKANTDQFFFTHGLYAEEITGPLNQVKDFLDTHKEEVVILDLQHFYGMEQHDHHRLITLLLNMFGARICGRRPSLEAVTLAFMHRQRQQVIIVYRHESVFSSGNLWFPQQFPTPWPNQSSVEGLLDYLQRSQRPAGTAYVHQAVLTPTTGFILLRWLSNLRDRCAAPVMEKVLPLLLQRRPGPPPAPPRRSALATLNIVIADFVNIGGNAFPQSIVRLNYGPS